MFGEQAHFLNRTQIFPALMRPIEMRNRPLLGGCARFTMSEREAMA